MSGFDPATGGALDEEQRRRCAVLMLLPTACRRRCLAERAPCPLPPLPPPAPDAGQEFPRGLQNEVLCVLKGGRRKCRMQLVRPRSMSFMVLSRAVWTEVGEGGSAPELPRAWQCPKRALALADPVPLCSAAEPAHHRAPWGDERGVPGQPRGALRQRLPQVSVHAPRQGCVGAEFRRGEQRRGAEVSSGSVCACPGCRAPSAWLPAIRRFSPLHTLQRSGASGASGQACRA